MLRGEPVIRKVVDEPAPESRRASVRRPPLPPAPGGSRDAAAGLSAGSAGPAPSSRGVDRPGSRWLPAASPWRPADRICRSDLPARRWRPATAPAASWAMLNVTPGQFQRRRRHASIPTRRSPPAAPWLPPAPTSSTWAARARAPASRRRPPDEEQARILPVIRALAAAGVAVSVDTRNAATMAAALDAGARIVNDVSGARARSRIAAPLVAARGCPVVLMHMRGDAGRHVCRGRLRRRRRATCARELAARIAAAERRRHRAAAGSRSIPASASPRRPGQSMDAAAPPAGAARCSAARSWSASRARRSSAAVTGETEPRRRLPGSLAAGLFAVLARRGHPARA